MLLADVHIVDSYAPPWAPGRGNLTFLSRTETSAQSVFRALLP